MQSERLLKGLRRRLRMKSRSQRRLVGGEMDNHHAGFHFQSLDIDMGRSIEQTKAALL
jgi:hypothetical protein